MKISTIRDFKGLFSVLSSEVSRQVKKRGLTEQTILASCSYVTKDPAIVRKR